MTRELESRKDLVDEKVTRHDVTRHCEEGKRSVARRGNLLNRLLRHFVPRNDGNSGNSQSLINVKHSFTYLLIHLFTSRKRVAFTMAEILITLAVIGIVAAMTIPNLVQSYKKKIVETKLIKIYSTMNQAIKLSSVDNGSPETWDNFGGAYKTYDDVLAWWNKYFARYINVQKLEEGDENSLLVYFADGSILEVQDMLYDMKFYIIASAVKNEKVGVNSFFFRFQPYSPNTITEFNKYVINSGFEPYTYGWDGTIEGAMNGINNTFGCSPNCTVGAGNLCTKLIQLNNWKIPEDYPYKF